MASIDGKLPNTRADLNNYNWLDYTTWQVLIYSIRAMKQLLIGAKFFYVGLYEWNCEIIHDQVWKLNLAQVLYTGFSLVITKLADIKKYERKKIVSSF